MPRPLSFPLPRWIVALAFLALGTPASQAQTFLDSPPNGMPNKAPQWHALTGATVHLAPGESVDNATVVVNGHQIVAILPGSENPPTGARIWDYSGSHLYSGFIDPFVEVAAPAPKTDDLGAHWNPGIVPNRRALDGGISEDLKGALREMGFAAAALSPEGGVFRGYAAVVSLAATPSDRSEARPPILQPDVFQTLAFDGGASPNSLMGEIALIRQTFMDARWNSIQENAPNILDSIRLTDNDGLPATRFLFVTSDELDAFRAQKIFREFGVHNTLILGSGDEYKRLPALSAESTWILPLDFPKKPSLASVGEREGTSLRDLMEWEQAPTNPARMKEAGFAFALSTFGDRGGFWDQLREAIEHGLSEADALAALTTTPATLLGLENELGRIQVGGRANLVVMSASPFTEDAKVLDVWVDGGHYQIEEPPQPSFDGEWRLRIQPKIGENLHLTVEGSKWTVDAADEEAEASEVFSRDGFVSFVLANPAFQSDVILSFSGRRFAEGGPLVGHAVGADGKRYSWEAKPETESEEAGEEESEDKEEEAMAAVGASLGLPFGPYALESVPQARNALLHDATIWTSGPAGILEDGAMWIRDGRIAAIGSLATVEEAIEADPASGTVQRISLKGANVTPGLIDCHSHTGISRGVNETAQTVTAEVDIGDSTNPDDINWYRQMAGGLTTVNSLHGSANPIGGQNQVNKLRWGALTPDDMHFEGSIEGIKFALGENVKRRTTRYPNTRMGVEAVFRERFTAAQEYGAGWLAHQRGEAPEPRRDLELEALWEILRGDRLIHCHSYRQDEILTLCRVAEDYGFKIGTFQHILEGYKVAEFVRDFSGGGSAFADWWAYKVEVQDAIPYAGAIMHNVGVTVSFNSDDSELARRMNLEAAKAIKYGGIEPQEALKFVTLNPARQLRIEHRVGSLEVGKDADFAIWNGNPLSTFTRCIGTWIDGREFYSEALDKARRERNRRERERLITKALERDDEEEADEEEDASEPADPALVFHNLMLRRMGIDASQNLCGECGLRAGVVHQQ